MSWYDTIPATTLPGAVPFIVTQEGPGGTTCFRSGVIGHNGVSQARFLAPSAGTFTVGYKTNCESNYDLLTAKVQDQYLNSTQQLFRVSGDVPWTTTTVHLEAGDVLEVTYTKDSSVSYDQDAGWITIQFQADILALNGKATLRLVSTGTLSGGTLAPVLKPLHGQATLRLVSRGTIITKPLHGQATLRLVSRHGTVTAPTGLNAQMKVITDRARPEMIFDQYLMLWFNGHPNQCEITLRLDDGAEYSPTALWMNPDTTGPAILKIGLDSLQGDGFTHQITVRVRTNFNGRTGPWAQALVFAKLPKPPTQNEPEWCEAVRLRQGSPGAGGPIKDLTRIRWRHNGAVKIMARIPIRSRTTMQWATKEIDVGYADYDETEFIAEGIGMRLEYVGGYERLVEFGVCAIDRGEFGPVLWAPQKVRIKEISDLTQVQPQETPDQIARTVRAVNDSTLKDEIKAEVRKLFPSVNSSTISTVVLTTINQTVLKIKDVVRKGGRVTLQDFARFEGCWNNERTVRRVGCTFSPGMKEGTRLGRILTDAEAPP